MFLRNFIQEVPYKEINIKIVRLDVSSSGDQKNDKNPFTISLQTELNNADELKKNQFLNKKRRNIMLTFLYMKQN